MGTLCVDLATTPGSVPGHDPLRLSCDSHKSTKDIRGAGSPGDVAGQPGWLEFSSAGQKPFSGAEM